MPVVPRLCLSVMVVALAVSACSDGHASQTEEDAALQVCTTALADRLGTSNATQTLMIGKRANGWLVRGLSAQVGDQAARNYECGLQHPAKSGPPRLTYLRLCEAGESPWGCPAP